MGQGQVLIPSIVSLHCTTFQPTSLPTCSSCVLCGLQVMSRQGLGTVSPIAVDVVSLRDIALVGLGGRLGAEA